jgi:hypothetical protein
MSKKPHHMHALTKASAKHLHAMGHIPASHRDQIIKSAERGMRAAKAPVGPPMPQQQPPMAPQGPQLSPGMGGGDLDNDGM